VFRSWRDIRSAEILVPSFGKGDAVMMRKGILMTIVLSCSVVAFAQAQERSRTEVQGEQRLRLICKQLDLTEEQQQMAEGLILVYTEQVAEERANPAEILMRVQEYYGEYEAAKAEGNDAAMQAAQEKIRSVKPGARPAMQFFENLAQVLTDEQKAQLVKLRQAPVQTDSTKRPVPPTQRTPQADPNRRRIEGDQIREHTGNRRVPPPTDDQPKPTEGTSEGGTKLRPFHVVLTAKTFGLTEEQTKELEAKLVAFRAQMAQSPPTDVPSREAAVNGLATEVRSVLTALQATAFDQQIEALRENAPEPEVIRLPGNIQGRPNPQMMPPQMQQPGQPGRQ
jgi:hypothetical protein